MSSLVFPAPFHRQDRAPKLLLRCPRHSSQCLPRGNPVQKTKRRYGILIWRTSNPAGIISLLNTPPKHAVVLLLIFRRAPEELGGFWVDDGARVKRRALVLECINDGLDMALHRALVELFWEVAYNPVLGDAVVVDWGFDEYTRLFIRKSGTERHSNTNHASVEVCHWPPEVGDLPDEWVAVHKLHVKRD